MATTYTVVRLGVKFTGQCVACGVNTGSRDFELAGTILLKDKDGKHFVAHPRCVGIHTKNKIGGGITTTSSLPLTVTVQ